VDLQSAVVVDETQLPKPVYKQIHPRAGCTHHLRKRCLAYFGNNTLRRSFFAEVSLKKEDSGQPLFARIEKVVNQILLVPNVSGQQISDEHVGQSVFPVERLHHRFLLNAQDVTSRYRTGGPHAQGPSCKAAFPEKIAIP
jgi:hypothetical protein